MAIRNIVQEGDEALRKKSRPAEAFDDRLATLLGDLRDTMHKADGVGLAAPQVGIIRRVAVVEAEGEYLELINPVILSEEGSQLDVEGCLSINSAKNCRVMRPMTITFQSRDRKGGSYTKTVSGLLARAVCHETDHLDGVLFIDKAYNKKD